jgi:hypothetical protein
MFVCQLPRSPYRIERQKNYFLVRLFDFEMSRGGGHRSEWNKHKWASLFEDVEWQKTKGDDKLA